MGHGDGKDDPGGGNSIVVRIRRKGDDNFSVVDGDDGRMDHDSDNEDSSLKLQLQTDVRYSQRFSNFYIMP
jgi:hypothetical protein